MVICQLVILEHRKGRCFFFFFWDAFVIDAEGENKKLLDGYLVVMGGYLVMNSFCSGKW